MKRLLAILLLFGAFALRAEEGELQFHIGGGGYFPLSLSTDDKTVVVLASWNASASTYFGFTDNFDLGVSYSVTYMQDIYFKTTFNSIEGKEYFNYLSNKLQLFARYNVYPGYAFSPHVIVGGGMLIETYRERAFLNKNDLVISDFNGADYAKVRPCVSGGFDVQYRAWEWLLLSLQTVFTWSPNTMHIETNFYLGATWFVKSYYF
jgi:hypothetical protein